MARKTARPGRTLVVFFLVMAIAYGLVALAGTWKPTLGLDLQGGTSITLRAEGDPGEEALDQARQIIDDRVNGSGVAEAEVTTQGGNEIVVEIPGENARNLIETVQRTAQLRFRLVACSTVDGRCATTTGLPEGIQIDPSTTLPQDEGQDGGQDGDQSQGGNNRAALGAWARLSDTQGDGADGSDGSGGQGDENSNGNRNRNGNGQQSPYDACVAAADALGAKADLHIANYGDRIEERLTGEHETLSYKEFRWGVSDRGASVRIPWQVARDRKGYIEDRRPNANCDPYIVTRLILDTVCGAAIGE